MIKNPSTPSPKPYIHRSRSATFDSPTRRPSTSPYSKSSSHLFENGPKAIPTISSSRVLIKQLTLPTRASPSPQSSPSTCSTLSSVAEVSDSDDDLDSESDVEARTYVTAPSPPPSYASVSHRQHQQHQRVRALHEDPDSEFIDPWLVRVVLDLYDVRRYDWTMIAEPIQRMWGISTSSAVVLSILQRNGRVARTVWWD